MATPKYYFIFTEDSVLRIPVLPDDILVGIFTFLPRPELRRISQASSAWYRLVYTAGLELHRTVTDVDSARLDTVAQIADHVRLCESPLRLSLELRYRPARYADPVMIEEALCRMCSVVARTLQFLARLSVHSTCHVAERLCAALSASAPYLRSLSLELAQNHYGRAHNSPLALPPTFLCGGKAPLLRTVTIDAPLLYPAVTAPDAMFAGVRAVNLTLHCEQTELTISELFPNAKGIEIHVKGAVALSLAGLTLRRLTFDNPAGHDISLSLDGMRWSELAEVSYTSPSLDGGPHWNIFWPQHSAPEFIAFLARTEGARHTDYSSINSRRPDVLTITVATTDGAWRCTLRVPFDVAERTALLELAALPRDRLTALVVSESVMGHLLHTDIALPALRSLHGVECVVRNGSVGVRG